MSAPGRSTRMIFHSWYGGLTYRGMNVVELTWDDGQPVVDLDEGGG